MVQNQRKAIGVSVCIAVVGVGLIVAAFATDHWIDSNPRGNDTYHINRTGGTPTAYTGNITFGLFSGYKSIDYGVGLRQSNLRIKCDQDEQACTFERDSNDLETFIHQYHNQTAGHKRSMKWFGLFSFPVYVTTLVMLVLAIVWGLVTIGFSVFNVFGRPIETITGTAGLYLWNIFALVFTLAGVFVYLGLYLTQLKDNILTSEDLNNGFTSEDLSDLDYSFYLVVGAAGAFIINLILLAVSGQKCSCSYSRSGEKEVDNGMILY